MNDKTERVLRVFSIVMGGALIVAGVHYGKAGIDLAVSDTERLILSHGMAMGSCVMFGIQLLSPVFEWIADRLLGKKAA